MQTTQKRAPVGGCEGVNGEFYEGGKFLPSTEKPKRAPVSKGSGKQEIAPYAWEVAPEGKRSIYRAFAGIFGKLVNGKLEVLCSDQTLAYFGATRDEAQVLADRWNAGERWMDRSAG